MYKILIIDDNHDLRVILRYALELQGFEVMEAADGQAGLSAITDAQPDLVLLDYNMPDLDGIEVAKRAREACHDMPIIFITANSSQVMQCIDEISKTDILPKPFQLETLSHRIGAMLH